MRVRRSEYGKTSRSSGEIPSAVPQRRDFLNTEKLVLARCWCDRACVEVSLADVRAGLTRPCNLRACRAIDKGRR